FNMLSHIRRPSQNNCLANREEERTGHRSAHTSRWQPLALTTHRSRPMLSRSAASDISRSASRTVLSVRRMPLHNVCSSGSCAFASASSHHTVVKSTARSCASKNAAAEVTSRGLCVDDMDRQTFLHANVRDKTDGLVQVKCRQPLGSVRC